MAAPADRGRPSWASSPATRSTMLGNRRRDTNPELAVRRQLHARGLRYRVDFAPPPTPRRRADIVFTRCRIAVFIDGCFWHGCPQHYVRPVTNADYWASKIERNVQRDSDTTARLRAAGWIALRSWEHEPPEAVADRVQEAVRRCIQPSSGS
ncbi:very short patch repair endonuclease [Agromyces binzhouensis]|uniref:very short patch repair endonuclease n=1 Tax=Agromyces binzhouensis TaxID=1817495 RepID=UPI003625D349